MVTIEKTGARTPLGRSSTKIAAKPQKVGGSSQVLSPLVEEVINVDQEGSPSAGVADTQMDEDSQEAGSKRAAEAGTPGSVPQARKVLKAEDAVPRRLRFEKFEVKDCGADGACGYNCIAVGAAVMRGMTWDELRPKCGSVGATLRVQVAQHIAKHAKDYRPMWSPDFGDRGTTIEKEDGDIPSSWESWLNAIRRHKRWICGLTIKAAATRLGIQLIVVLKTSDGGWGTPMAFGVCQKKESPVVIGLDEKAGHYVLLLPDSPGDIPNSWRAAQSGEVTLVNQFTLRGAGQKKDSPQAWLPPSTPRHSAPSGRSDVDSDKGWLPSATPKSNRDKQWLPHGTPSLPRGSVRSRSCPQERELPGSSTDIPDVESKKGSRVVEPSVSGSASLKRKHVALSHDRPVGSDGYVWTCGICNVVLRDPLPGKLSQSRATHVANRHRGQGREAGYIQKEADTVVPRADLPPEQRVWTCAYCDVGLPLLDKWTLEKSKIAHFKSAHPRKKITGTNAAKQVAKRVKKNPALWPQWADKSKAQSQRMRLKYEKTRDLKACGHSLVEVVNVDWESWPGTYKKKVRLFTCSKCWIVCRGHVQNKHVTCRGNFRVNSSQRALWKRLRHTGNGTALLNAWGVSAEVADERFAFCRNPSSPDFDSQGHDWRRLDVATKQAKVLMWTCLRCRVFHKDVNHFGACKGLDRKLNNRQCDKWKNLTSQPLVRRELCKLWQIKIAEANKWFRPNSQGWVRNLREEGLEPNPGPLCAFHVLSCNVNSARGAWSVLDHVETLSSKELWVLALQETKMLEQEQVAFSRACRTRGFRCFHAPGRPCSDRWGQDRALGGCTILVDSRLQARADIGIAGLTSQICGVWVQGWFVCAMYAPPRSNGERGPQLELCGLLHDVFTASGVSASDPWLLVGDVNEEPAESVVGDWLASIGGTILGCNRPTRWGGSREVDWFASNHSRQIGTPEPEILYFSDHIPLSVTVSCNEVDLTRGCFRSSPCWTKPDGISRDDWISLLEKHWASLVSPHSLSHFLQTQDLDVDYEWACSRGCLDDLMRGVFFEVASSGSYPPEIRHVAVSRLQCASVKGGVPRHCVRQKARGCQLEKTGCMRLAKLRKRVARLYELRRSLLALHNCSVVADEARVLSTIRSLQRRLRLSNEDLGLGRLESLLAVAKTELVDADRRIRSERLVAWKSKLQSDMKFAGKWLKSRQSVSHVSITTSHGDCDTNEDAVDAIVAWWKNFWDKLERTSPDDDTIAARLLEFTPPLQNSDLAWCPPTPVDLLRTAVDMRGSAGADMWRGDELACFPLGVWTLFEQLTRRWLQGGGLPAALLDARMILLPKEEKRLLNLG